MRIIVVDSGVDGQIVEVCGGRGTRGAIHGTMVAFDALIAAPDADIVDRPVVREFMSTGSWTKFLAAATKAYDEIRRQYEEDGQPTVVVNGWTMSNRIVDLPADDPENYSYNPDHPFNRATADLVASGVDVLFPAGNCGAGCPYPSCGPDDVGPDQSIHGPGSLPDVITVAAVTVNDEHLGFSSEGRGAIDPLKPDISGCSHFLGSRLCDADSGTSTACPVVGGVVAALRSTPEGRRLSTREMKELLLRSARRVHAGDGWDRRFGWGIVDAGTTFEAILQSRSRCRDRATDPNQSRDRES